MKSNMNLVIFHYYFYRYMEQNFRENLRSELSFQGVTVKELSARTGIPIATLDCYLGTRATVPSVDAAFKIAQALQVSIEYLVMGEEASMEYPRPNNSKEARTIIRWAKSLNNAQCRAVLNLILAFNKQKA